MLRRIILAGLTPKNNFLLRLSSTHDGGNTPNQEITINNSHIPVIDYDDPDYLPLPVYPAKINEPLQQKKARLTYQSRKRGMLENDLLLSTFAAKYLASLNEEQTHLYDQLINGPTNDWDIYYWAIGNKPTPKEYDTPIMDMLKLHTKNVNKEQRLRQPDL